MPIFGMFFAAGAVADVGAGGGGGDGAGAGDAGDLGDGGAADGGDPDLGGDADAGADADPGGDGADGDADEGADADRAGADAARNTAGFTAEDKKLLTLAQQAGPKEAQRIKQLLFGEKRLLKVVPGGVKGVVDLVRSVEEFGGVEGIQTLQDEIGSYHEDAEMFSRADPRWVESGFEENPEAALKLFDHTLDYIAEHHGEHYSHKVANILLNQLGDRKAGLPVHALHQFLTTNAALKDSPEAKQLAAQLARFYNNIDELASKAPEKKPDAQNKALSDREAAAEKKEMDLRFKEVNQDVFPQMKSDVIKTLQAQAKTAGLDLAKLSQEYPGEWRSMLNEIHQEIMKAAAKDQRFIDKHYALVKKGDLKRAAAAVNAKHAAIIPDIARRVMLNYGVFRGKKAAAGPGNKGANNRGADKGNNNANATQGWTKVSARPANSAIDWSKTTSAMQIDGKYILNDGKKVVVQY